MIDDPTDDPTEEKVSSTPVEIGTARWRRDFPYTSAGEDGVTRREFTRYLVATSGTFAAAGVGVAAWSAVRAQPVAEPRPIVDASAVAENTSHLFRYPTASDPAVLLRLEGGELRAYSQKCTHLGCVVFWRDDQGDLYCPCHEGHFDPATGSPTAGPPDRSLPEITVEVRDGVVWATGISG